jgi:hypothetical protein
MLHLCDDSIYCSPFGVISIEALNASPDRGLSTKAIADYPDPQPDALSVLIERQELDGISAFLESLKSRDREIAVSHFFFDETQTSIA